jgi:hypothetical protein
LSCCPNSYTCDGDYCRRSASSDFLAELAVPKKLTKEESVATEIAEETQGPLEFPSITDIITCIKDIQPVIADFETVISDVTGGKIGELVQAVKTLIADGTKLGSDCAKIVEAFKVMKN